MQNKRPLLQRLLVIYVAFFIVLAISIAHSLLPNFTKGFGRGTELGKEIAAEWMQGNPCAFYLLSDVAVHAPMPLGEAEPAATAAPTAADSAEAAVPATTSPAGHRRLQATAGSLDLLVVEEAPGASPLGMAFRSIGGTPWLYALTMLNALVYPAIIVLMCIIIRSLRRSIRNECTLDRRNTRYLRAIGALTILSELCSDLTAWWMNRQAAEVLAGTGLEVDTNFAVSYGTIIMGILVLFAAEVFAIGQQLSEEQKLTI